MIPIILVLKTTHTTEVMIVKETFVTTKFFYLKPWRKLNYFHVGFTKVKMIALLFKSTKIEKNILFLETVWFPVTHIISEWKLEWCKLGEISVHKQNILSNGRHRPSLNVCLKNQTRVLWSCLAEKNWRNRTVVVLPEEYLPYNLLSRLMPRQKAISSPQALTSEARTVEADLGVIWVKTEQKHYF